MLLEFSLLPCRVGGKGLYFPHSWVTKTEARAAQVICCVLLGFAWVWGLGLGTGFSRDTLDHQGPARVGSQSLVPSLSLRELCWGQGNTDTMQQYPWGEKLFCQCSLSMGWVCDGPIGLRKKAACGYCLFKGGLGNTSCLAPENLGASRYLKPNSTQHL